MDDWIYFNFYINYIIVILICILSFIAYFFIQISDLDIILYAYELSPLFDFDLDIDCKSNSHIIFHVWKGWTKTETYSDDGGTHTYQSYHDITNIDKINGKRFCYKAISYKELLYNGQIIKNGEECPDGYKQNCGIIDTLGQSLCIKIYETCPLYDIGIGQPKDIINYHYNDESNIYYNNNNYNGDKKIIGTLILSDGQPCYDINEKLWRKFDSNEVAETYLTCKFDVFGKTNDDRYEEQGSITYKKIYEDNLPISFSTILLDNINNEKVSLYKRILIGIDKNCDEKTNLSKNKYDILKKNQSSQKKSLLAEAIIILPFIIISPFIIKNECIKDDEYVYSLFFIFCFFIIFIICHSVFLGRIIHYIIFYNCSDSVTNEILRIKNKKTKIGIIFSSINLGLEVFFILANILFILYKIIKNKCCQKKSYKC